jgi:hypothetical protein
MMLGGQCSPCCPCSTDELYALWQRLQSASCTVSLQADCKRQHGATCVNYGFAHGDQGLVQKYFADEEVAYSAQRFFFRPTPDYSGSHELSLDLSSGFRGTVWDSNGAGTVRWKLDTIEMSLTVVAYLGTFPSYANGYNGFANVTPTARCPVYYTVSAEFYVYNFYTRRGIYDPSPYAETQYTGTYPQELGPPLAGTSYTTNLASAGAPIAVAYGGTSLFELGFYFGADPNPPYSSYVNHNVNQLGAWWPQYFLALTDQQIRDAGTPSLPSLAKSSPLGNYSGRLAEIRETLCRPTDNAFNPTGEAVVDSFRLQYSTQPWQWIDNDLPAWMENPTFSTFYNYVRGKMMSVRGGTSPKRYAQVSDVDFNSSLSVSISDD